MTRTVDAVVIGSGHNGLVAAAYLARAGWSVEVLEQATHAGGAVATEELTAPGYRHDTFAGWHPVFQLSMAWRELGEELRARGLDYLNSDDVVTASVLPGGEAIVAHRDPVQMRDALGPRDAEVYERELAQVRERMAAIGALRSSELHSLRGLRLGGRLGRLVGIRELGDFSARITSSARGWLEGRFEGRGPADLLAPWVLHTGLGPEDAGGGFLLLALTGFLHRVGLPTPRGGSAAFAEAFVRLIEDHGGRVRTGQRVESIMVRGGRAVAVRTAEEEIGARRAVIANTTVTQLYGTLLPAGAAPPRAVEEARRFRFSRRAGTQIHLALSTPPRWRADAALAQVPVVHLTAGIDGIAQACHEAARGLLPAEPTIACGQPTALDPSRAPAGGAILWLQLQEVPYQPLGDAAGEIDVGDGSWTPALEDAFLARIVRQLGTQIEGLEESIVGSAILSPRELERRNPNFVRGDIYSGATDLAQSYLWRPLPSYGSHQTPVPGLLQCGAGTFPGPGLNAASGYIVAQTLLRPRWRRRLGRTLTI